VWLAGEALPLERKDGRLSAARLDGSRLVVAGPDAKATAAIERWYRREARRRIGEVVRQEAVRLGFDFRSVAIRDPRTRWGSCSRRGNLSFSWRLLIAPTDVLHYVIVHELCHLREPSHQKAFWRLLESLRPGWQLEARWLASTGKSFMTTGPKLPQRLRAARPRLSTALRAGADCRRMPCGQRSSGLESSINGSIPTARSFWSKSI
jgi:predicted metal-dependent hydrolase